jgi:hypothetical protein
MRSPANIKNEMLSPTDKMMVSARSSLFNFNIKRINSPGIMVKKANPRTNRSRGIFERMTRSVEKRNISIDKKGLFALTMSYATAGFIDQAPGI